MVELTAEVELAAIAKVELAAEVELVIQPWGEQQRPGRPRANRPGSLRMSGILHLCPQPPPRSRGTGAR